MEKPLQAGRRSFFGPLLPYDLIRLGRRGRYALVRSLFALVLLGLLALLYSRLPSWHRPSRQTMAELASSFFYWFMIIQFLAAILVTPAYTAGAIAEEKERKTMPFLMTTDLSDREIILSKFASRFLNLLCLILTGLPILCFVQFWGGVDPDLLIAGCIATVFTVCSIAALSLLHSLYASKASTAIVMTYLTVACYYLVTALISAGTRGLASGPATPSLQFSHLDTILLLGCSSYVLEAGNIFSVTILLRNSINAGMPVSSVVPGLLVMYVAFHSLVIMVCYWWSLAKLRTIALREEPAKGRTTAAAIQRLSRSVGIEPMIWKELFVERGLTVNRFGRALIILIILASLVPAAWLIGAAALSYFGLLPGPEPGPQFFAGYYGRWWWLNPWDYLGATLNVWVRYAGSAVACLLVLAVGVRAAAAVTSERDKQTLDMLLTTPLLARNILRAKWLGSLASVRWVAAWLCLIWGVGLVFGGLDIVTLPWLMLACAVYACFLASLGLWCSVRCRNTQRATTFTIALAAGLGFGHWLIWPLHALYPTQRGWAPGWLYVQVYGLTPPLAISWLSFRGQQFVELTGYFENPLPALMGITYGLVAWGAAAVLFQFWAVHDLEGLTARQFRKRAN
jgi:ABC-type transport system involved in multi-copper enzyme maturation permease subunit